MKAIALGAQAVFRELYLRSLRGRDVSLSLVGRPYIYGLCLEGQKGVEEQIRAILADFEVTLGLAGYKDVKGIYRNRDFVTRDL